MHTRVECECECVHVRVFGIDRQIDPDIHICAETVWCVFIYLLSRSTCDCVCAYASSVYLTLSTVIADDPFQTICWVVVVAAAAAAFFPNISCRIHRDIEFLILSWLIERTVQYIGRSRACIAFELYTLMQMSGVHTPSYSENNSHTHKSHSSNRPDKEQHIISKTCMHTHTHTHARSHARQRETELAIATKNIHKSYDGIK